MCGIFLWVGTSLFGSSLEAREYNAAEIAALVDAQKAAQTVLSENDSAKVKNAEALRQCQQELSRLSVKNHGTRVSELKSRIAALTSVSTSSASPSQLATWDSTLVEVMARGPDYAKIVEYSGSYWSLRALSSVLSLRQPFSKQPHCTDRYIFQFNGELYNEDCLEDNDVEFAWSKLLQTLDDAERPFEALAETLGGFRGEFAFTLVDKLTETVYFGKDTIGKRSLLYSLKDGLAVSSVLDCIAAEDLVESEPGTLYAYNVSAKKITKAPYKNIPSWTPIQIQTESVDYTKTSQHMLELKNCLSDACQVRQITVHPLHPTKSQVAVLFSGGLDCTVLAALLAENYATKDSQATIDLLTVGFENPRTGLSSSESPDRQLSERSWYELSKKFCGSCVSFRLVQVDVSYAEWLSCRSRVLGLIHPTATEMDLSIAIAFYFASQTGNFAALKMSQNFDKTVTWEEFRNRRDDFIETEPDFYSSAKVLFSGLGADELMGGYSRHESIFDGLSEDAESGEVLECYERLTESLLYDIKAIYQRNLGRDDRAISSWGKELRYPYLDESVVTFLTNMVEPQYKVKFDWVDVKSKKGTKRVKAYSRKYILRQLAHSLGLPMAADEAKRAIQFGAKSAKLEVGQSKTKGTEKVI